MKYIFKRAHQGNQKNLSNQGQPLASRWRGLRQAVQISIVLALAPCTCVRAQDPITVIIREAVIKVIKAVDLKIQRIQTETIWLQEAQKEAENIMSKLRLDEIRDWVQRQKDLYGEYFEELWKVKQVLADYHKVSEIIQRQKDILGAYNRGLALFRQDTHFTPEELQHIEAVFAGILSESGKNLDRLITLITSFTTQMADEKRMELIDGVAAGMEQQYSELAAFTGTTAQLSLERARDENDYEFIKKLYGL